MQQQVSFPVHISELIKPAACMRAYVACTQLLFICAEDEQFREEKAVIIKEISMLDGPPSEGQPAGHVW